MNLLKLALLVFLGAAASLIITNTAQATDHPWDDNGVDSTHITGYAGTNGEVGNPRVPDSPIIRKIELWMRNFYREIRSIFVSGVVHESEIKPGDVTVKRVSILTAHRKQK